MNRLGSSLDKIVEKSNSMNVAYKSELNCGDTLIIVTKNSTYVCNVLGNDVYLVSGGWFDREGLSPTKISVAGCTWGGRILKTDVIAACGLKLEFDNRVVTTRIKKIILLRGNDLN